MDAEMRVLAISPHPDDMELGCGGYLSRVARQGGSVLNLIIANGNAYCSRLSRTVTGAERRKEAEQAMLCLGGNRSDVKIAFEERLGTLDLVGQRKIIEAIDREILEFRPTEVLVPLPSSHQDHLAVWAASLASTRPAAESSIDLVAAYEYPATWWGPGAAPVGGFLYVELDEIDLERKLEALMCHGSQVVTSGHPWSLEAATAMATERGLEANYHYAERMQVLRMRRPA